MNPEDAENMEREIQTCSFNYYAWDMKTNKEKTRIATSALFVYLSPLTRHPLGFNCNARQTDKDSVLRMTNDHNRSYKDQLNRLDEVDSVSISATRQTYFLVTSLRESPGYDTDEKPSDDLPTDNYTHMRSMTNLTFTQKYQMKALLLSDHEVRNPTVQAINQLLFLVGASPFVSGTEIAEERMTFVAMEQIFQRFATLKLHDPAEMKKGLVELGFDFKSTDESTPIWKQWTMLSFFLQMSSPITFSALDGGHRTWAIISMLTGKPFDIDADFRDFGLEWNMWETNIDENCAMLAKFETHIVFNERKYHDGRLRKEDSKQAQQASKIIKKNESTLNKTTRIAFLANFLIEVRSKGLTLGSTDDIFNLKMEVENNRKSIFAQAKLDLDKKLVNLMIACYEALTTTEPYMNLFEVPDERPTELFGKLVVSKPFEALKHYLDPRFINDSMVRSRILQKKTQASKLVAATYALTHCAMFSDVLNEIVTSISGGNLNEDLYRLEKFCAHQHVHSSICHW